MEEISNSLRMQTIRAKLELSRVVCASLAEEFDDPRLSLEERAAIAREWERSATDGDVLALFLDLLRHRDKSEKIRL